MRKDKSIIVVDNDKDVCLLYRKNLELNNYKVNCFNNSKKAYTYILDKCKAIAIVIWDIWNPGPGWKERTRKLLKCVSGFWLYPVLYRCGTPCLQILLASTKRRNGFLMR